MGFYEEAIAALEALARRGEGDESAASAERYWHMGVMTPSIRRLARQFSRAFRTLSWPDQVEAVFSLLRYGSDEAAHLGIFVLGRSIDGAAAVDEQALGTMVELFRGWSVTDAFCIEVLQPLLKRFPAEVQAMTAGWSRVTNRWKRRASVVLYTRRIGASGRYTQAGLRACDRLIGDADDLVRKAVGWALKDLMKGDRETVLGYVGDLRRRGVPSVITLYALRDVRGDERRRLLAIKP